MLAKTNFKNEDFFQKIGHICIFFATLDFFITLLFLRLIKDPKSKSLKNLNDNSTLRQKIELLNSVHESDVIDPKVLINFKKNYDKLVKIADERNRYIHDQWVFIEEDVAVGNITRLHLTDFRKGVITPIPHKVNIKDFDDFLKEIGGMQKLIGELANRVPNDFPAKKKA